MAIVVAGVVAAATAFAVIEPIQVLPRIGLAPGYALTDQDGGVITSEDGRGALTLYSFAPIDCGRSCDAIHATMGEVGVRAADEVDLGGVELRLITVALDPVDDPAALEAAAVGAGADGERWRWIGGDSSTVKTVVGSGFGRYYEREGDGAMQFDPGYVLVDGEGVVRGDYRYRTLSDDADKLLRHLAILGDELAHRDGAAAVAYEAAHLFLCYP